MKWRKNMQIRKLQDQPLQTDIKIEGQYFFKHAIFPKDSYIPQHSHSTDHISLVTTGAVRLWRDDVLVGDFYAFSAIPIAAHTKHLFLALEPMTTVVCVHRLDENGDLPTHHDEHSIEYVED